MSRSSSLIRALDVLTVLAGRQDGITISEIVDALGQPRSNVVRIVNTLIEYGLVYRKGRRLLPTDAFFNLCTRDRYAHLRAKYRKVLQYLSIQLNELVLLGIQEGNGIVHIDFIESDHRVRVAPSPITRHDLRNNAIGKVALARRPDLLAEIGDDRLTSEIQEVRRTGIGWNREETTEGVVVIACPGYTNHPSEPILAVAWPTNRFTDEKARAAKDVMDKAKKLFPALPI
ncbi:MAG: helix-turn-helix domain-containing protein [Silicimonas sp.]|jgi:IclR family acetate operon transcriptional repressor|uniref:IclR family transcriptional regulator n=1 Tax=Alphaproteobacteria TaxID=28211 RepID=UPI0032ED052D